MSIEGETVPIDDAGIDVTNILPDLPEKLMPLILKVSDWFMAN